MLKYVNYPHLFVTFFAERLELYVTDPFNIPIPGYNQIDRFL